MAYRKIGFCGGGMSLRGLHIALFDYAYYSQQMLGVEPVVYYDGDPGKNDPAVLERFKRHFEVVPYQDFPGIGRLSENRGLDALYIIKSGEIDHQFVDGMPNLIHAVFPQKLSQVHGAVYAFVSGWLSRECSNNKLPFVPHMIELPGVDGDLRASLNIPAQAKVFGCYGGSDSFNLKFVHQVINRVVATRSDIYFVFMNIQPFAQHEKIIFLPGNADLTYKVAFINTCDAMIHARGIGESFGLACGEFSVRNKPVITYALSPQRSHLDILGDKAMRYKGPRDLEQIFLEFDRNWAVQQNWDCYSENFSPRPVMNKFEEVFLRGDASDSSQARPVTPVDRYMIQYFRARKKLRSLSRKLYL